MPLYVCASGSTPLAALLIAKGVSPGAAIAFLLTGPATNVTTFGVLARLHSKRTALFFAGTTALATMSLGWMANLYVAARPSAVVEELHEDHGGVLAIASTVILLALFVVSLLRQGTRNFVGQVISPHGASAEHDHGHDHGHEHGGHEHAVDGCGVPASGCGAPASGRGTPASVK